MNPVSDQAFFVLGCVAVIAFLVIALILLAGFTDENTDPRRTRTIRMVRTGMKGLTLVMILVIAWSIKNA